MQLCGSPTMSERHDRVLGVPSEPFSGPLAAAALNAALISSTVTSLLSTAVKSVIEPSGTGTRSEVPSSLPFIDSSTRLRGRGPRPWTSG